MKTNSKKSLERAVLIILLSLFSLSAHADWIGELTGEAARKRTAEARQKTAQTRGQIQATRNSISATQASIQSEQAKINKVLTNIEAKRSHLSEQITINILELENRQVENSQLISLLEEKSQAIEKLRVLFEAFNNKTIQALQYAKAAEQMGDYLVESEIGLLTFIKSYSSLHSELNDEGLDLLNEVAGDLSKNPLRIKESSRKIVDKAIENLVINLPGSKLVEALGLIIKMEANAKAQLNISKSVRKQLRSIMTTYQNTQKLVGTTE